jgi:hypothetical protein
VKIHFTIAFRIGMQHSSSAFLTTAKWSLLDGVNGGVDGKG